MMDDMYTEINGVEAVIRVTYFHAGYPATSGPDAEEGRPPYVEFKVLVDGIDRPDWLCAPFPKEDREALYYRVLDYCLDYKGEEILMAVGKDRKEDA
jgi:hypothetical protein